MIKRNPIRKKVQNMVLTISIVALILTSAIGILSMLRIRNDSENALTKQMEQNLRNITTNKADLAESELGKFSAYTKNFADSIHEMYSTPEKFVKSYVPVPDAKYAGILAISRSLKDNTINVKDIDFEVNLLGNLEQLWKPLMTAQKDVITTIYFGTETGLLVAYDRQSDLNADNGNEVFYDHLKSEWYTKAKSLGHVCFTDIYNDIYDRGLTITCAAPVYDDNNKFIGAMGMDILISDLYRSIVEIDLGDDKASYAFLVDNKGNIIDNENASDKTNSLSNEKGINSEVVNKILSGQTDVSLTDDRIYFAYTPIESNGWKFCVRMPESVILAPVRSVQRNIIFMMSLFLAAFILITIIVTVATRKFSKDLTNPIISLSHDVEEISGGNLDYRAKIYDNDEIGDLAKSFNDMAVSLKDYINNLAYITAEKERISTELNVATQIQADMLPRIFPAFPERKEFDIYASMNPAKEVGGDFYDFFFIDDKHLALVMADVSGKGVPAALFMVISKTLIKTRALMGGTPSEILYDVNNQLCEGNDAGLFVTVWLGILDIETGKITAANAGHEYPALKRVDNTSFELLKDKHTPAVATIEEIRFKNYEIELTPGDVLFIYTDGVAEATNSSEELYGTDRMIKDLNKYTDSKIDELLINMKKEVDKFTGDAPQFDDITMLGLRYFGTN
ncbi:MAG: SpoIIE family protein phosphatase [Synergistaceae bacterium]|nr:SpoIIE family protein phosphatase [Synergistaceae bacterium]